LKPVDAPALDASDIEKETQLKGFSPSTDEEMFNEEAVDCLFSDTQRDLAILKRKQLPHDNPLLSTLTDMSRKDLITQTANYDDLDWNKLRDKTDFIRYLASPSTSAIIAFFHKHRAATTYELFIKTGYSQPQISRIVSELKDIGFIRHKGMAQPRETRGGAPAAIYGLIEATPEAVYQAQHKYYVETLGYDPVDMELWEQEEKAWSEWEEEQAEQERLRLEQEEAAKRLAKWEAEAPEREAKRKAAEEKRQAEEQAKREAEEEEQRKRLELWNKRRAEEKAKKDKVIRDRLIYYVTNDWAREDFYEAQPQYKEEERIYMEENPDFKPEEHVNNER